MADGTDQNNAARTGELFLSRAGDDTQDAAPLDVFGLHCVREPASNTCVIFVHGILSSGETAWGEPSWPELLKTEPGFEHLGIYIFTYRTSLFSRTYGIADAADALREHLRIDKLWTIPNIVFVCHSMGGIVIRRFLVANQVQLFDAGPTIGLFLVASPSLGSRDANMLSVLSYALQHTQAATLRFSQANTSLDELHRDFKTLLNGDKLCIVGRELLEDLPIKVKRWFGLRRQVVEPFSASAYFHQPGCEPLKIPGSDHATIVKPMQRRALQHRALKGFLEQLPNLAHANRGGRLDRSQKVPNPEEQVPARAVTSNIEPPARSQILHPEIRAVPGFTGRADLLESLDRALWQHGGNAALTDTETRSAAVHGLDGVGKSVLAQEYGWRNRVRYHGVWWLRAEQPETLIDDLIALGSRLIPGLEEIPEKDRAAHLTLDAIAQKTADKPWLLIYDNAEKPTAIEKLTPRSGAHLLITSRWPCWQSRAESLPVDVFPEESAVDFLLTEVDHETREAARRLASALGYLPLALKRARDNCIRQNCGFEEYITRIAPALVGSSLSEIVLAIEMAEAKRKLLIIQELRSLLDPEILLGMQREIVVDLLKGQENDKQTI